MNLMTLERKYSRYKNFSCGKLIIQEKKIVCLFRLGIRVRINIIISEVFFIYGLNKNTFVFKFFAHSIANKM